MWKEKSIVNHIIGPNHQSRVPDPLSCKQQDHSSAFLLVMFRLNGVKKGTYQRWSHHRKVIP